MNVLPQSLQENRWSGASERPRLVGDERDLPRRIVSRPPQLWDSGPALDLRMSLTPLVKRGLRLCR